MAAFAILHPSGLQGRESQREPWAAALQQQPSHGHWDWQHDTHGRGRGRNTALSPPIPLLPVILPTRFFCPIYNKNVSSLSSYRCITVPWKIVQSFCSPLHGNRSVSGKRVWGKGATGLFWIGCFKQESGKIQADKSVCRQPRHKKSSSSQMR